MSAVKIKRLILFCILVGMAAAVVTACGSSAVVNPIADIVPGANQDPPSTGQKQYPVAESTFNLHLPAESHTFGSVFIAILDEVTGLDFNPRYYEMEKLSDSHYAVTLSFPTGSLIKYRYITADGENQPEYSIDGYTIIYRCFYADGPGEIHDQLARWKHTSFAGGSGKILGTAVDKDTNTPLSNIIVSAAGQFTTTRYDGSFDLYKVPAGSHQLTFFSLNGTTLPYKQNAVVEGGMTTSANVQLDTPEMVNVQFTVRVPDDIVKGAPIRIAGNLWQFGYTMAEASSGSGIPAVRMPEMHYEGDFRYTLNIKLAAGTDLHYKYTLGDGFWSSEHSQDGKFFLRQLIVPQNADAFYADDQVLTFDSAASAAIWFDVNAPDSTPGGDHIHIQFKLVDWMPSIPMWYGGGTRWGFRYSSPTNISGNLEYRYCRNGICGQETSIAVESGLPRYAETNQQELQAAQDIIDDWYFLANLEPAEPVSPSFSERISPFTAGIQFSPDYTPSWDQFQASSIKSVVEHNANALIFTPTWTYYDLSNPWLKCIPGSDILDADLETWLLEAENHNLDSAIFPQPDFRTHYDSWWTTMPRDAEWWDSFFEHYQNFILHYAAFAEEHDADTLLIGGEWMLPALPSGLLPDGEASGIPADAEQRWQSLINQTRTIFSGKLGWVQPHDFDGLDTSFLQNFDEIHLSWYAPITEKSNMNPEKMADILSEQLIISIEPTYSELDIPVILHPAYPSADGAAAGCVLGNHGSCIDPSQIRPGSVFPESASLDLDEQAVIYQAFLLLVDDTSWISGLVADDYFPPMALTDLSANVHGKPAGSILSAWFEILSSPTH